MKHLTTVRRQETDSATGSGTGLIARNGGRAPMSRGLRAAILAIFTLLWLTGVAWLVLHVYFPQQSQLGPLPNAWEPLLMRVHGVLAVGAVFLFGWIMAAHLIERWGAVRNRRSGMVLAACGAILVVSGYALYYTTGTVHEVASRVHEILGTAAILVALTHWRRIRTSQALTTSASLGG
jgi:hypothetical protein